MLYACKGRTHYAKEDNSGLSRAGWFYTTVVSEIIHGRRRATPAEKAISEVLNILDDSKSL